MIEYGLMGIFETEDSIKKCKKRSDFRQFRKFARANSQDSSRTKTAPTSGFKQPKRNKD